MAGTAWPFTGAGGELFLAETLTPPVQVMDRKGTLLREITWEVEGDRSPLHVQEAVAESVALLRGGEDPGEQATLREGIRGASLRDHPIPRYQEAMEK